MRICYFGAFDPQYARNNLLRAALADAGIEVVICNVPRHWPTWRKAPALIRRYLPLARRCDLILVAEFGQALVPLGWLLGRLTGKPVAFDFLISLYQANVEERRLYAPGSWQARRYRRLDRVAASLPDRVLVQTRAFRDYAVRTFDIDPAPLRFVPLGVDKEIFHPLDLPSSPDDRLIVLYFGSYIPNHGVDVILHAADLADDPRFLFRFIGEGEGKPAAEALAASLNLSNVDFQPRLPFADLPGAIAQVDIVLGVFGDTPQAQVLLANKVIQGLAMRRLVVAGDTLSNREFFTDGEHLLLTPLADPAALADTLRRVADMPTRDRARIAAAGYQRFTEHFTHHAIGQRLAAIFSEMLD
jgi:glycosyltransferase involved in cell wall biosynthesis